MENGDAPTWRSTLHAAVLVRDQGDRPSVLLLPDGDSWVLPRDVVSEQVWWPESRHVIAMVQQQLGVDAIVLGCAAVQRNRDAHELEAMYLLEPRHPDWAPPPVGRVADRASLAGFPLGLPSQYPILDHALAEITAAPGPGQMPWMRPGWFATASTWMLESLERAGIATTGSIEQFANWGISCVLRVPTAAGDYFFKATPPGSGSPSTAGTGLLFANEPALLATVSTHFPEHVPTPLAIDRERRWQLLADVGQQLADYPDYALWEEAMRAFARLQIASAELVDDFLQVGCLDRRFATLPDAIEPLLADSNTQRALSVEELDQLRALSPRLRSICAELADLGLPATLVHGDLHAGNIAVRDGTITFFDWTDACVSHPFIDVPLLCQGGDQVFTGTDAGTRLREAYLSEWTAFAPIDRLRAAYAIAAPLVALHHAISYRSIVANVDPVSAHDLRSGLDEWLHEMLASLTA